MKLTAIKQHGNVNLIATWEVPAHADKQFYDAMLRLLAADPSHVMLFWRL